MGPRQFEIQLLILSSLGKEKDLGATDFENVKEFIRSVVYAEKPYLGRIMSAQESARIAIFNQNCPCPYHLILTLPFKLSSEPIFNHMFGYNVAREY